MVFAPWCQGRARTRRAVIASGARDRLKANAVGRKKKQAGLRSRDGRQDGHSLPSHHKITFWSGNFTPCRVVLPVGDGRQYSQAQTKRVSSLRFQQFRLPNSKESGVRWGRNDDVAVIFCTSFLCLKMADRPLWLEQQVPCQQEFTLNSRPPAL